MELISWVGLMSHIDLLLGNTFLGEWVTQGFWWVILAMFVFGVLSTIALAIIVIPLYMLIGKNLIFDFLADFIRCALFVLFILYIWYVREATGWFIWAVIVGIISMIFLIIKIKKRNDSWQ